jgi:uncharacterized membrane-anchored protein YitT (DUF2179 family)
MNVKQKFFPLEWKRIFAVIIFTLIYAIGVVWFVEASNVPLYSGGVLGISQLFRDLLYIAFGQVTDGAFLALVNFTLNIPILILGWRGVSHRFTVYTLISVFFQTVFLSFIPKFDFGLDGVEHVFAASSLGGLLIGIGAGGALRYGASTGGVDIIAQYVSIKSGQSVAFISLFVNLLVTLLGALLLGGQVGPSGQVVAGGVIFSYTVVRILASTIGLDIVHTSYQHIAVQIISSEYEKISEEIIHTIHRGATLLDAQGAYSKTPKKMIYVVISRYELETLLKTVKLIDEKAFIVSTPVRGVYGNFTRKIIT